MANYDRELRMRIKGKMEKVIEFAKRMKKYKNKLEQY